MAELVKNILDARSRKGPEKLSRVDIIQRELHRALANVIEHLEDSFAAMDEARGANEKNARQLSDYIAVGLENRLIEATSHPSQNLPGVFYQILEEELKELWRNRKEWQGAGRRKMDSEAQRVSEKIIQQAKDQMVNLADAAMQSNAGLDPDEMAKIQRVIVDEVAKLVQKKQLRTGWRAETEEELQRLTDSITTDELQKVLDGIRVGTPGDIFDESHETVQEAKTILFGNIAKEHYAWIDFDGARRAAGHSYSKYAALIHADIVRSAERFNGKEYKMVQDSYGAFRKNALLNHSISTLLQDPRALSPAVRLQLEHTLDILKGKRYQQLEGLIRVLNEAKHRNYASGVRDVIYLSDRVKFIPRLDHKTIEAAKNAQANWKRRPWESKQTVDDAQFGILQNILNQVLEINQLAQERRRWNSNQTVREVVKGSNGLVIPQIMVAMAEGPEDILALRKELDFLRDTKVEDKEGKHAAQISLVPLFESEGTVAPESIRKYLDEMWEFYTSRHTNGAELFAQNIDEVFIAGSDLSKEMGQSAALVKAWEAAIAVEEFNKKHETNVRVKLGTGEAAFRQGGYFDPEGYLRTIRGKITDYKELSPEEAQEKYREYGEDWEKMWKKEKDTVQEQQTFLEQTFGANWKEIFTRKPRGYNRLLNLGLPFRHFTSQSWSREQIVTNIDWKRLRQMMREATERRDQNVKALKDGTYLKIPEELKNAIVHEQKFYQSIFGKNDTEKTMFGRLLQFCATGLPAPQLRDRALGRERTSVDIVTLFENLGKPFIEARAISANTASGYLFPLYLIGKGSMLQAARESKTFGEVMKYVDAKEILRQMKVYGEVAQDIFTMLRDHDMRADADILEAEWNRLIALRSAIREEMWRQEGLPEVDVSGKKLTEEQKRRLVEMFIPGTRELFDDEHKSDRTMDFRRTFEQHRTIIPTAMTYIEAGNKLIDAISATDLVKGATNPTEKIGLAKRLLDDLAARVIADSIGKKNGGDEKDLTLQALYDDFKIAESNMKLIRSQEYGAFLADLVTAYSPGM